MEISEDVLKGWREAAEKAIAETYPSPFFADTTKALLDELEKVKKERDEAFALNEFDRSKLCDSLTKMRDVLRGREWLASGRGCYEYDDDRWYKEFGEAISEIHNCMEDLQRQAGSWTFCPRDKDKVLQARVDLRAKVKELEEKLADISTPGRAVWKQAIASDVYNDLRSGEFHTILELLWQQMITPGKAAEAIAIRALGEEPELPGPLEGYKRLVKKRMPHARYEHDPLYQTHWIVYDDPRAVRVIGSGKDETLAWKNALDKLGEE